VNYVDLHVGRFFDVGRDVCFLWGIDQWVAMSDKISLIFSLTFFWGLWVDEESKIIWNIVILIIPTGGVDALEHVNFPIFIPYYFPSHLICLICIRHREIVSSDPLTSTFSSKPWQLA
jgi:hypothetical protein